MPAMDQKALAEIKALEAAGKYEDPRYMELLMPYHYAQHLLRMPPDQWPDPVNRAFKHINPKIYVPMQGPSELGASGKLADWDRTADLKKITVPTLVIGAQYDTMDPNTHGVDVDTVAARAAICTVRTAATWRTTTIRRLFHGSDPEFVKDVDVGR